MPNEIEYSEKIDAYRSAMVKKINTRKQLYLSMQEADNDSLTAMNVSIDQVEEYRKRTELLEDNLRLFNKMFEA